MRSRQLAPVLLAALLIMPVAACSEDAPPAADAVGTSELAPENNGGKAGDRAEKKRAAKAKEARAKSRAQQGKGKRGGTRARPAAAETDAATSDGGDAAGDAAASDDSPAAQPEPSGPIRASVSDATGDVRGTLTGAPPHADLTGATLTRGDVFEVRVSFAGAVPQRQTDDRIVQVATFYDLDGDGETDYEVWASLADNGWGTSYRTPTGARYGDDSGARARPEGNDLVITFPLAHLERAASTAWAVGAQWGTLEQVASGTTSRDNAPDGGWARLPR